jgi:hypothetical protein
MPRQGLIRASVQDLARDLTELMQANGAVEINPSEPLRPGDSILVLPKVETKGLQTTKDIIRFPHRSFGQSDLLKSDYEIG